MSSIWLFAVDSISTETDTAIIFNCICAAVVCVRVDVNILSDALINSVRSHYPGVFLMNKVY